ncbi:MAG: hypothetical protein NTY83_02505, partial [Candidatus Micrarchaeota archaeon]|nr:hypothetical protein [Candidatus Micrarchaeota archaeon]
PPVTPPPVINNTTPVQPPVVAPPPQTQDRQQLIEWYVMSKLMGADGGVKSDSGSNQYSSSSIWLAMEYALETNDEALFEKEYQFLLDNQLDSTHSLAYAAMQSSGVAYTPIMKNSRYYSSTGDNLRMVRYLFDAKDKWGVSAYSDTAWAISNSLLANAVFTDVLVKESYWSGSTITPATRMRTADPEWIAMQRLSLEKEGWTSVMERTRSHTLGCGESGLFWPEYNVASPMCDYGEGEGTAKTVDTATTAIALAEAQTFETAIITYSKLTNEYNQEEIISSEYAIPHNGAGNKAPNAATYALMGRLATKLDRCDFAASMRDEVLKYFVSDSASLLYGSIAVGGKAYAYDNLQTLLFLEEYADRC